MKMKEKMLDVLSGGAVIFVSAFLLCCLFAALLTAGILPMKTMEYLAWGISFAACFLGGIKASRGGMPLPTSLMSTGAYLLLVFLLRGLIFQSVGERPLAVCGFALAGAVLGAVTSAGNTSGRKHW